MTPEHVFWTSLHGKHVVYHAHVHDNSWPGRMKGYSSTTALPLPSCKFRTAALGSFDQESHHAFHTFDLIICAFQVSSVCKEISPAMPKPRGLERDKADCVKQGTLRIEIRTACCSFDQFRCKPRAPVPSTRDPLIQVRSNPSSGEAFLILSSIGFMFNGMESLP